MPLDAGLVYKIVSEHEWIAAEAEGRFIGSPVDLDDGFIHFSTAEQAPETASRHFSGRRGLLLVSVETAALGEALKWEPSRGQALFPHLYDVLPLAAVVRVDPLPVGENGEHVFPAHVTAPGEG
ncbi:MAG: DUF952 domain-containing protein [Alphaproteobacteria bacterium HGW-Alphaproteobacteria-3]|nr:MAG: DUF952 domain-containing protein [Alphaproteobacteria bacterium HGW-Alphaproteobacteria-3]